MTCVRSYKQISLTFNCVTSVSASLALLIANLSKSGGLSRKINGRKLVQLICGALRYSNIITMKFIIIVNY